MFDAWIMTTYHLQKTLKIGQNNRTVNNVFKGLLFDIKKMILHSFRLNIFEEIVIAVFIN